MLQYKKFDELPKFLEKEGIQSPFQVGMNSNEIVELLKTMKLSDEMTNLSEIKMDEENAGHNSVSQTLVLGEGDNTKEIHIVSEVVYEEYDHDYDTWQYIYSYPMGWF